MVSLIHSEYLSSLTNTWKTTLFFDYINEKSLEKSKYYSDNNFDVKFWALIKSVVENNYKDFIKSYSEFSGRKPDDSSPWIYDDFLIFILIIGIIKFKIDKIWIENVVAVRESRNKELREINLTFSNILSENYNSKDNLFELIFVYQELQNYPIAPIEEINLLYKSLVSETELLNTRNEFLKIIRFRAIDIIVLIKELPNSQDITSLKSFKSTFLQRINVISNILYVLLCIFLVVGIIPFLKLNFCIID